MGEVHLFAGGLTRLGGVGGVEVLVEDGRCRQTGDVGQRSRQGVSRVGPMSSPGDLPVFVITSGRGRQAAQLAEPALDLEAGPFLEVVPVVLPGVGA